MDRKKRLEELRIRDERRRSELLKAYTSIWNDAPRPPATESDSAARTALVYAWDGHSAEIVSAIRKHRSWEAIARAALPDFPPPLKERSTVYYSGGGDVYHRYGDCEALAAGKAKAESQGKGKRAESWIKVEEAEKRMGYRGQRLRPCSVCVH